MTEDIHDRAKFHAMTEGCQEDWAKIGMAAQEFNRELPNRVLAHLKLLEGDCGGFAVDRLTHSLQAATLAHRDGMDEEYVVCALLHDIGDTLGWHNHSDIAAAILKPFVSEEHHWMVEHHGIFQGYYFFHFARPRSPHARSVSAAIRRLNARRCSARGTTRTPSIRITTPCRSKRSSRWSIA